MAATSRFASEQKSSTSAINTVADVANIPTFLTVTAVTSGSSGASTAATTINGMYRFSSGSTYTLTTVTAALLVAALPNCQVGTSFDFWVVNANSGDLTITGGTGVTVALGTAATNKSIHYKGIVTVVTSGSEAVTLHATTVAAV